MRRLGAAFTRIEACSNLPLAAHGPLTTSGTLTDLSRTSMTFCRGIVGYLGRLLAMVDPLVERNDETSNVAVGRLGAAFSSISERHRLG